MSDNNKVGKLEGTAHPVGRGAQTRARLIQVESENKMLRELIEDIASALKCGMISKMIDEKMKALRKERAG